MSHYQGINNQAHELPEVSSPLQPHTPDTPYTPTGSNAALHHNGSPYTPGADDYAEKGGARGYNPAHKPAPAGWSTRKKWIVGGTVALICGA